MLFRVKFHNVKHLSHLECLSRRRYCSNALDSLHWLSLGFRFSYASHIMKRYTCIFTSILQLLSHTLLTSAAAVPTSIPLVNAPILRVANTTLTSTGLVPLGTRVPFDYQGLTLVFTNFGKIIPSTEVKDTLAGADNIVQEYLDIAPEEGIPQNRFEYRSPQGHVLLAIGGSLQSGITWRLLYRVIQALERFMVTLRPPLGPNYRELNFDIQKTNPGWVVGNGVIWYLPPDLEEVQKRTTTTSISAVSDASLLAFNSSTSLTNNDMFYPILGTSMALHFYYIGLSLPPALVMVNLQGAIELAGRNSFGPLENETIRGGVFRQITSGATSSVATHVFASENHQISWRQLYNILDGLRLFVLGQRQTTTHYQTLGCRIVDDKEGKIGVVTLAYYDPLPPPGVERRAMADRKSFRGLASTQTAKSTNQTMLSIIRDSTPVPLQWSIPDTDLTLTFKVFGDDVLLIELLTLLGAARLRIASNVQRMPNEPIGSFRYQNGPGTLVLVFITYDGKTITWQELHEVLVGLTLFCADGHSQASFFEIDVEGEGGTGFGVITADPLKSPIQKRDSARDYLSTSNSTSISPEDTTAILGVPSVYPIPGTPITLKVTFVGGTAIPPVDLTATLTSALRIIEPHVVAEGHQAIAGNRWTYGDMVTRIAFTLFICPERTLLWQELSWILIGIIHWMTAEGSSNCRNLAFDFEIENQEGVVGYGIVLHDPSLVANGSSETSTIRMREATALVEEMSLAPASEMTFSPSSVTRQTAPTLYRQNLVVKRDSDLAEWSRLQGLLGHTNDLPRTLLARSVPSSNETNPIIPMSYNIPHTNIVLRIQLLPTMIPPSRIASIFNLARQMLAQDVMDRPDALFDEDMFFSEVKYLEGREVVAVEVYPLSGEHLTYKQLYSIILGLQLFTGGDEGRPFRQSLTFKVDIEGGYVAIGQLSYFFLPPKTNTALTARSVPSSNGTNFDPPIPYHIPNSNIDLRIQVLPAEIPAGRITSIFDTARHMFAEEITEHPDESFHKTVLVELKYVGSQELIALTLCPQVNITFVQLYSLLNGLQRFMEGAEGQPFRNSNDFDVDIEGVHVAFGFLLYVLPETNTSALTARSLSPPPPNTTLTEPIPYPIPGTPITLAFTSLEPTPIPLEQVQEFFYYAFGKYEEDVDRHRGSSFKQFVWSYHLSLPPNTDMSLTIYRKYGQSMTWKTLGEVLAGVLDFMEGRWRLGTSLQALGFNIEIVEHGVVGRGVLHYAARRLGLGGVAGVNSSISNDTSTS